MKRILLTETFETETYVKALVLMETPDNQDGLWGIYQSTSDSGYSSAIIPIDLILGSIYEKEHVEFDLFAEGDNSLASSERTNDEIEEMCE